MDEIVIVFFIEIGFACEKELKNLHRRFRSVCPRDGNHTFFKAELALSCGGTVRSEGLVQMFRIFRLYLGRMGDTSRNNTREQERRTQV